MKFVIRKSFQRALINIYDFRGTSPPLEFRDARDAHAQDGDALVEKIFLNGRMCIGGARIICNDTSAEYLRTAFRTFEIRTGAPSAPDESYSSRDNAVRSSVPLRDILSGGTRQSRREYFRGE